MRGAISEAEIDPETVTVSATFSVSENVTEEGVYA